MQTLFVKYNRLRRPEYALRTTIKGDGGRPETVIKTALYPEGRAHIEAFADRYRILTAEGRNISYTAPVISADGMSASWPYIPGRPLSEVVLERINAGGTVRAELERAADMLAGASAPVHNIDSILDNYIVGEDGTVTGIDYEWVSQEEQDPKFVRFRILDAFYISHKELCDSSCGVSDVSEFLETFGIGEEEAHSFRTLEDDWQMSVHGDMERLYLDRYRVVSRTGKDLKEAEFRSLTADEDKIGGLKAQLEAKNAEIRKMTEIKRLTDNHVNNLEVMISDLRKEIDEMGRTLTYLNRHESPLSKVRRKAGSKFNEVYPKGSNARKKLYYNKMAVRHPLEYIHLKTTPEGKNLIEGDYAIGEEYLTGGRLHFPETETPEVSIIIPVYNQIGYTYRCLRSILEHTQDISYEVIIADDVSTDATCEMEKWAEGVTVSRNEVNLGFLRNCNHAAELARGRYIMFLNNDTEVCEDWLASLLRLMERDSEVGMCGSKLIFPDGRLQEAGGIIWSDGSGWNYGRGDDPGKHEYNYVRDVDYISGAAIMIRTELWKSIGGFDERYAPAYCEDSDLAFEVRKAGYRVVYQPQSVVIHYEGISNGTDVHGTGLKRYQLENSEKLREKWADELRNQYENDGNPDPFRARERSRGKKIILVIDHYVPTYDRDAGSKTTWQYLQLFVRKGYEVKFVGDNFFHEEPYTSALEQLGIEVLYGEDMRSDIWKWIESYGKELHLVYLNRPHIAGKYIDYIRNHTSLKVIYYGHDLHFLRESREYLLTGNEKLKESAQYWKSVELGLIEEADISYYPSQTECDAIHELLPDARLKAITAYVYNSWNDDKVIPAEQRKDILFVGGFAHAPNKDAVLWFTGHIWPRVHRETGANFHIVGSHADDDIKRLASEENGIIFDGYVSDERLAELYRSCRIVAAPLRFGAGVKGKIIEALYYGCPVVTTSVGAEGIPDAECVMDIADDEDALAESLTTLYSDMNTLEEMSAAALSYVREHHGTEAVWNIIKDDFE